MKKIVCVFLALLTLIPCLAWADGPDYSSMTADELRAVIADARAALAALEEPFTDKCVVYDDNGIKVTITAVRKSDYNETMFFDVTVVNKSDTKITVRFLDTYINGWKASDDHCYVSNVEAGKNARGEIHFTDLAKEVDVTMPEQIEDFAFKVRIMAADNYATLYETDEQTVTFAW